MTDARPNMKMEEEYIAMGLEFLPSGQMNEHQYYKRKYGLASVKDSSWSKRKRWHRCCKSKRAYRHKMGCKNRIALTEIEDDLSDLKDI